MSISALGSVNGSMMAGTGSLHILRTFPARRNIRSLLEVGEKKHSPRYTVLDLVERSRRGTDGFIGGEPCGQMMMQRKFASSAFRRICTLLVLPANQSGSADKVLSCMSRRRMILGRFSAVKLYQSSSISVLPATAKSQSLEDRYMMWLRTRLDRMTASNGKSNQAVRYPCRRMQMPALLTCMPAGFSSYDASVKSLKSFRADRPLLHGFPGPRVSFRRRLFSPALYCPGNGSGTTPGSAVRVVADSNLLLYAFNCAVNCSMRQSTGRRSFAQRQQTAYVMPRCRIY